MTSKSTVYVLVCGWGGGVEWIVVDRTPEIANLLIINNE